MRRFALYGTAAVVLFSLIVTVLKVTTHPQVPQHCPKCGGAFQPGDVVKRDVGTYFMCRRCTHSCTGPVSPEVSWAGEVEHQVTD